MVRFFGGAPLQKPRGRAFRCKSSPDYRLWAFHCNRSRGFWHYIPDMDTQNWYVNIDDKGRTVLNLVRVGADVFSKAKLIQEYDEFAQACSLVNLGGGDDYQARMLPFVDEYLVDSVRVCLFFENYMKARLIERRRIVHEVKDTLPELRKAQKKRPISFDELVAIAPFTDAGGMNVIHTGLKQMTVGAKTLFEQKDYRDVVDIPAHFYPTLMTMTKDRNRLHFMNYRELGHNENFITVLGEMKAFVQSAVRRVRLAYG